MTSLQRPPEQRPAGRSERIGHAVRDAVITIVAEGNTSDLTFERIAACADVSRGTLYRRWGNQPRLLTWALLDAMATLAPSPDTGSFEGDVIESMTNLSAVLTSPIGAAFLRVALIDAAGDEAIGEAVDSFWEQRLMSARPVYERAIERGELDASLDPELVTDLIYGPLFYRVIRGRSVDPARAQQLVRATLPNLTPN